MKARALPFVLAMFQAASAYAQPVSAELRPANGAVDVNPDARLRITFPSTPPLGNKGKIRVYDAASDSLVDELDLSIPPGPKNNRTRPPYDALTYSSVPDTVFTVSAPDTDPSHVYQKNFIGGTTDADAYRFFPVLIDERVATICLHSHRLEYNKTYYVQVDAEVFPFPGGGFSGIGDKTSWKFSTKSAPPAGDAKRLVVSADGSADFDSVQGAIDSTPDKNPDPKTIFIESGVYEEIVYFRNKANLTLLGEDREQVIIRYANNGVFNPSAGHNRRAVFATQSSPNVNLINFSVISVGEPPAQAEGLLVSGEKYQVHDVTIVGSGDALQATGKIYLSRTSILGYGDNVLGYGAVFFNTCELGSTYGPHLWVRNTEMNRGNVFVNSRFYTVGDVTTDIARAPTNGGIDYPYAEAVLLNCSLEGVRPRGWGDVGPDRANIHYWEYNSVDEAGKPADVSQRAAYSRQLTMASDSEIIANYSDPAYVLGGWKPELAPIVLNQLPQSIDVAAGGNVQIKARVAAAPDATYQWLKDGQPLAGKTSATLDLMSVTAADHGEYSVSVENSVGKVTSSTVNVVVDGAGAQTGAAGASAQAGNGGAAAQAGAGRAGGPTGSAGQPGVAGAAGRTSPTAGAGMGVPQAGASGTVADSAGAAAVAGGDTAPSSADDGGCRIGAERGTGSMLPAVLAALWMVLRARRRRAQAAR